MLLVLKFFALAYSALLPVINPLGSALLFLAVVGSVPPEQFRYLARRVAVSMVLFLLVFEGGGAALLNFFGISLPVVQLAGGFVLAAMGWRILDQKESTNERPPLSGYIRRKSFLSADLSNLGWTCLYRGHVDFECTRVAQ